MQLKVSPKSTFKSQNRKNSLTNTRNQKSTWLGNYLLFGWTIEGSTIRNCQNLEKDKRFCIVNYATSKHLAFSEISGHKCGQISCSISVIMAWWLKKSCCWLWQLFNKISHWCWFLQSFNMRFALLPILDYCLIWSAGALSGIFEYKERAQRAQWISLLVGLG